MSSLLSRIGKYLRHPRQACDKILLRAPYYLVPDSWYIRALWNQRMPYPLNLKAPKTYNEKLQWLKLHDRKDIYTRMVDKYEVKSYVSERIGEEYIIPTLGVWDRVEDIEWDTLPNQFVLKCTHDSGGLVICKDKEHLDKTKAIETLTKSLRRNYFYIGREWSYKNVKPRIIAEQYMEDEGTGELRDYKFFCFSGKVKALFVVTERFSGEEPRLDFFDREYHHLAFERGHRNATITPQRPVHYEKMIELAEVLSKDICHVRADFYEVNGRIFFGELTLYPGNGIEPFTPEIWDRTFGDWLKLPTL